MVRAEPIEERPALRRRLAEPVVRVGRIATWTLVVAVVLLVVGVAWLVYGTATDSLTLELWAQALIVLGLCALVGLAALATRLTILAKLLGRILR